MRISRNFCCQMTASKQCCLCKICFCFNPVNVDPEKIRVRKAVTCILSYSRICIGIIDLLYGRPALVCSHYSHSSILWSVESVYALLASFHNFFPPLRSRSWTFILCIFVLCQLQIARRQLLWDIASLCVCGLWTAGAVAERNAIISSDCYQSAFVPAVSGASSNQFHQWEHSVSRAACRRY